MKRALSSIIRDPIWQFIGVIIAVIALIIAILPFFGKDKALQIVILSRSSLVKIDESVVNEFTIPFQDKTIESLDLITIKLENSGKQSIRPEDYEIPITFIFPESSTVIGAKVVETFPPNIPFDVSSQDNRAIISKSLFNEGEKIILEFKVINLPSEINNVPFSVTQRIYEISDIPILNAVEDEKKVEPIWQIYGIILSITATAISLIFFMKGFRATSLRIKLVENIRIAELADYELEGFNITYHGKNVENLSRLVVEIQNTGNTPIFYRDYIHPIKFGFPQGFQVIDGKISKAIPPGINATISVEKDNSFAFTADLLNPKDSVVLNFIVSNVYKEKNKIPFMVTTRIIGLRNIIVQ